MGKREDESELDVYVPASRERWRAASLADWMAHVLLRRRALRGRNRLGEASLVRTHIEGDALGLVVLVAVEHADLRAWLARMMRKTGRGTGAPLSAKVASNALTLIRQALQHAVDEGILERNVARDLEVPRGLRRTTRTEFDGVLEPSEQERLLETEGYTLLGVMMRVALGVGLRRGELLALRWEDVHLVGDDPFVVIRFGSHGDATKGGQPRRLPLFGVAFEALRRVKCWKAAGLVFPGAYGGKRTKVPAVEFRGVLRQAGITRRVRWHDLRHTCATSLLLGWWGRKWSPQEVQRLLGHSSVLTTERYLHARNESVFQAAREMRSVCDEKETHAIASNRVGLSSDEVKSARGTGRGENGNDSRSHPEELKPRA